MGSIVFSPLAQGMLTSKYLKGIPADSRAAKPHGFLKKEALTDEKLAQISQLNDVAAARGQTLAQMAIAWVLRQPQVTSALIGASRLSQVVDCVGATANLAFSAEELAKIEAICGR
jgi:L-glyceraldehyde 3-phosphate reductase